MILKLVVTSKILIHASPSDGKEAEEKLSSCIDSLNTSNSLMFSQTWFQFWTSILNRSNDYRVEISASPASSEGPVKYNTAGYKECVQDTVYQVLATTTSIPVQQSFPKPVEWEPQTDPIELKYVHEGSSEWTKILNRMRETIPYVEMVLIDRIQNEFLWEKYCQHKERMSRKGSENK